MLEVEPPPRRRPRGGRRGRGAVRARDPFTVASGGRARRDRRGRIPRGAALTSGPMQAAVLTAPGEPLSVVDLPTPVPGDGEVLVSVEACAVCRTDLHLRDGEIPPAGLPRVLGHQIVGSVVSAGPGASLALGERVGIPWLAWADGSCDYCRSGRENLCTRGRFTGRDVDGGFAEFVVANARLLPPAAAGRGGGLDRPAALRGPDRLPRAPPGRPLRVAPRPVRLRERRPPDLPGGPRPGAGGVRLRPARRRGRGGAGVVAGRVVGRAERRAFAGAARRRHHLRARTARSCRWRCGPWRRAGRWCARGST